MNKVNKKTYNMKTGLKINGVDDIKKVSDKMILSSRKQSRLDEILSLC